MPALRPASVAPRTLAALAARLGVPTPADPGPVVTGVTHDSRAVRPGDLYAALPGSRAHGAAFAADAAAAGAVAVLTDPEGAAAARTAGLPALVVPDPRRVLGAASSFVYGDPSTRLKIYGVTGTNGKTTTAYLLEAALRHAGERTGLVGTIETRIDGVGVPSVRTTPEAPELQSMFAVMVERGVTAVAMEVSSHALALHRVDGTLFRGAVFTNLSRDHLDFHRDLEDYFAAKSRLFSPEFRAAGVVNLDDPWAARLTPPARTFAVARPDADWRAVDVELQPFGARFRVVAPGGADAPAVIRLPGDFNVSNALGAIAVLAETGVPLDVAATGVGELDGVPGRMEPVDAGQPFLALVDYAHTPDAVSRLLAAVRPLTGPGGRVLLVLGCGGDRDREKRPEMGAIAADRADVAVFTNDNPRSEDPQRILDAMLAGVPPEARARVVVEPDRAGAIGIAVAAARRGDVVVVAGKGHERGQEQDGIVTPFDDRAVLATALRQVGA